jgi:hypothetical protein
VADVGDQEYWENFETGPFCRHWESPGDCQRNCAGCGHGCTDHALPESKSNCEVEGCACKQWTDKLEG